MIRIFLADAQATEALGERLASVACPGWVIYLRGDLGTGKTTLVRGFLRALGHQGAVKSPTYTLVEPYTLGDYRIFHLDLYRLADPEELEFIGLRDYLDGPGILLIEWPERGEGLVPPPDIEIELNYVEGGRLCCLRGLTAEAEKTLASLPFDQVQVIDPGELAQ